MNLNSIISYKKRGKINKQVLSTLKNDHLSEIKNTHLIKNHQTIDYEQTNNQTQKYFASQMGKKEEWRRKVSFQSMENDRLQQQHLMTLLKQKFTDQFQEKINHIILNNKFKAQNVNMNININYNSIQSARKKSSKKEKQLSMYMGKNKKNLMRQFYQRQKNQNQLQSKQKSKFKNQNTINFKGTFGVQQSYKDFNSQNLLLKSQQKYSLSKDLKKSENHSNQKVKSYKDIYSAKFSNEKNYTRKITREVVSRSLNLRSNNVDAKVKKSKERFLTLKNDQNQFETSDKNNLFVPQIKQKNQFIKTNLRYRSLQNNKLSRNYRYQNFQPQSKYFVDKSVRVRLKRQGSTQKTQKLQSIRIINKNSLENLKKQSFRNEYSNVKRILTQESKQKERKRIYHSIKKNIDSVSQSSSFEKIKNTFQSKNTKKDFLQNQNFQLKKKQSIIVCFLKCVSIDKIIAFFQLKQKQNNRREYITKSYVQRFIEENGKNFKSRKQENLTLDQSQIEEQILKLMIENTQNLSQKRLIKKIEKSQYLNKIVNEMFNNEKSDKDFDILRKSSALISLVLKFRSLMRKIFELTENKMDQIQDQDFSFLKRFSKTQFQLNEFQKNKEQKNYIEHFINCLNKQTKTMLSKFSAFFQQNKALKEKIFEMKLKLLKIILINLSQIINHFEVISQEIKIDSQSNQKVNENKKIIKSFVCIFLIELKLIELIVIQKIIILKSSKINGQNWQFFHENQQFMVEFTLFLKSFEQIQKLRKNFYKDNFLAAEKKNSTKIHQKYENKILYDQEFDKIIDSNFDERTKYVDLIILIGILDLKNIFNIEYSPNYLTEDKTNLGHRTITFRQFYIHLKAQFRNGKYFLCQAYKLYHQKEYHHCQMFIDDQINQCQSPYLEKLICLSLMIKIKNKYFYEAETQIQRLQYSGISLDSFSNKNQNINKKTSTISQFYLHEIKCFERFISAVIFLIKRKTQQGLQSLKQTQELIQKYEEMKQTHDFKDILPSFTVYIQSIISSFFGYAYYCIRDLQRAKKQFQQQMYILSQSQNNETKNSFNMVQYNYFLCQGLIAMKQKNHRKAINYFEKALEIFIRPQPHVYLAIVYLKMLNLGQLKRQVKSQFSIVCQQVQNIEQKLYNHLNFACKLVSGMSNNFASQILYFRSLYDCWKGIWDLALIDIDDSIEKSQENYTKHFYLRALIFACGQNYSQAINEVSIVISIDDKYSPAYLLRSKCSQIQGNQNQAFIDLQTYISLRPEDTDIHKYAGHLLFQNGAFQDAILAYQQGQSKNIANDKIEESDFHVYLTKSKTYFLLGQFEEAAQQMKIASKIKCHQLQYQFDCQMIQYLSELFKVFENYQISKVTNYQNEKNTDPNYQNCLNLLKIKLQELQEIYGKKTHGIHQQSRHGKIFKNVEFHVIRFSLLFYLQKYEDAITQAAQCIKAKQINYQIQNSDKLNQEFQEEQNQKQLFISQMHYNMALTYLKQQNYEKAEQELLKCQTSRTSKGYLEWKHLLSHIVKKQFLCKEIGCEQVSQINVFTEKNKLTKFYPYLTFKFENQQKQKQISKRMKLCIPYPKVQPPQISPSFDISLLTNFNEDNIQKKPQAPWITNQKNSIKFTDEIKTFSRLDIDDSQNGSKLQKVLYSKRKNVPSDSSDFHDQIYEQSFDGNENRLIKKRSSRLSQYFKQSSKKVNKNGYLMQKQKKELFELLKLNPDVENKLKKLVH